MGRATYTSEIPGKANRKARAVRRHRLATTYWAKSDLKIMQDGFALDINIFPQVSREVVDSIDINPGSKVAVNTVLSGTTTSTLQAGIDTILSIF